MSWLTRPVYVVTTKFAVVTTKVGDYKKTRTEKLSIRAYFLLIDGKKKAG